MGSGPEKRANAAEIDRLALAVAKDPDSKAFIPLAEEYGKAGMWEEAAAVLEDGLKAFPNFITAMVALGRVYDQLNQSVKATAILEEAVKLSPENLRAHRTLAKIYTAQGQQEAALRSCRVILTANPQDQEAMSISAMSISAMSSAGSSQPDTGSSVVHASSEVGVSALNVNRPTGTTQDQAFSDAAQTAHTETGSISNESVSLPEQKSAEVAKLEQYLALIRSRRIGHDAPPDHTV